MTNLTSGLLLAQESGGLSFPVLTSLIVVPFLGAIAVALVPRARVEAHQLIALAASVITGASSVWVLVRFDRDDGGFQFRNPDPNVWIESLGIRWDLAVDGISLFLVVLTGFLFPLALSLIHI